MTKRVVGFLILAAGHSRRFGRCKLSEPLAPGQTLLQRVLAEVTSLGAPVKVVTSQDRSSLIRSLDQWPCDVALMADPSPGLGASIAFGVQASSEWDGWVICLGDMPWLTAECYQQVLTYARIHGLVAPRYKGERGHPVYFSKDYYTALCSLKGDKGAASLITQEALFTFPTSTNACLRDVDTPDMLL